MSPTLYLALADVRLGEYRRNHWGLGNQEFNTLGEGAHGSGCLTAQILKDTKETCGDDDVLILSADMKHDDAMPIHTIALYREESDIAVHDDDSVGGLVFKYRSVQGIHSRIQNRIVFNKFSKAERLAKEAADKTEAEILAKEAADKAEAATLPPPGHVCRVYHLSPPPSFVTWALGNSRNRANWQV